VMSDLKHVRLEGQALFDERPFRGAAEWRPGRR
jgi:hypothetical protein